MPGLPFTNELVRLQASVLGRSSDGVPAFLRVLMAIIKARWGGEKEFGFAQNNE